MKQKKQNKKKINKCKQREIVIVICFSIFMLLNIYFLNTNILETNLDKFFSILALIISFLILCFKNNKKLVDLAHFLYCGVYLTCIALFSSETKI